MGKELGGCFVAAESGNRGEKGVMASLAYTPEVAYEEARLVANDRLRRFVPMEELLFIEDGQELSEEDEMVSF